jgi:ubiquitin-activating enzyme E1 C
VKLDGDNPDHINWCLDQATARGLPHSITGITYSMTQGVVKNIIPAIASTNAIVAASCANEAYKIATSCHVGINNYMMYTGDAGVYTYTFELEPKENCPVCGTSLIHIRVKKTDTVQDLIDILLEKPEM